MIDTLVHHPETPSTRQLIARSAITDGFLSMLLNHEGAFHGPAWGTKLLLTAVWASLVDCISNEGTALLFESEWLF